MLTFSVGIIGSSGVGKTAIIERVNQGSFIKEHIPNEHCKTTTIKFNVKKPIINESFEIVDYEIIEVYLKCYDTVGQDTFSDHSDLYKNLDSSVIVYDVGSKWSYINIDSYKNQLLSANQDMELVVIGNKVDTGKNIPAETIVKHPLLNLEHLSVSAKHYKDLDEPFLHLIRRLVVKDMVTKFIMEGIKTNTLEELSSRVKNLDLLRNSIYLEEPDPIEPVEAIKRTFKVCLVGPANSGKTTYLKKLRTKKMEIKYLATIGVEVHPLKFQTNKGEFTINFWDCAGDPKFSGLGDGYYIGADGFIIMAPNSLYWIKYINSIRRVVTNAPCRLILSKDDKCAIEDGISTLMDFNLTKPIEGILRTMTKMDDLKIE